MGLSGQPLPTLGSPNSTEDSKVRALLAELQGIVNGGIDTSNLAAAAGVTEAQLAAALTTRLGVGAAGRGKSIIATTESRTNVAYGTLATPDAVSVTLPVDGLIVVAYQATWQESVIGAARAAIFLGGNQLRVAVDTGTGAGVIETTARTVGAAIDNALSSYGYGLQTGNDPVAYGGDVTTGQLVGVAGASAAGPCYIFAAAGTYTVSVQFKASSGSVTAKNRKLWVWTMGF